MQKTIFIPPPCFRSNSIPPYDDVIQEQIEMQGEKMSNFDADQR